MSNDESWSIKRAFNWTRDYLTKKGDEQARLSTEWLLADACGLSRLEVYTQFDKPLSVEERNKLRESVRRRAAGEPLQYITGTVGFRHLDVGVRPGVLIPRPETEVLVDLALKALPSPQEGVTLQVLDLCTGSGCVGLSIADERPDVQVLATDICPKAVSLANENAQTCNLHERFTAIEADLFDACSPNKELGSETDCSCHGEGKAEPEYRGSSARSAIAEHRGSLNIRYEDCAEHPYIQLSTNSQFDLIVSNPPYIPTIEMDTLPQEVADFEPALALHGGEDGLDIVKRILEAAPRYLKKSSHLILELDVRNAHAAADFAVSLNTYNSVEIARDLTGRERFVFAKLETCVS